MASAINLSSCEASHFHNNLVHGIDNCRSRLGGNFVFEIMVSGISRKKDFGQSKAFLRHFTRRGKNHLIKVKGIGAESELNPVTGASVELRALQGDAVEKVNIDGYDDGGSNGCLPPGNEGGGGGDGGGEGEDEDEKEFGPVLKFDEVLRESEKRGANLPSDMLEAAKSTGIRELILRRYLDLQGSVWPLSFLMQHCSILRNRMLADPSFLFKVGTEIVIDSSCATFAEYQKRGKEFWAEFELYLADLLVGVAVDIALVGMLAPYARIGKQRVSRGFLGGINHACAALPSSVFEAERPGCRFSVKQRIAAYFYKGLLYGSVGFGCGIIGQGIANLIMTAKRNVKKSDEDVPVPPLIKSAALWGVFLAVSSNTRYQVINGLECLVEASPVASKYRQLQWPSLWVFDLPTTSTAVCNLWTGPSGAACSRNRNHCLITSNLAELLFQSNTSLDVLWIGTGKRGTS